MTTERDLFENNIKDTALIYEGKVFFVYPDEMKVSNMEQDIRS